METRLRHNIASGASRSSLNVAFLLRRSTRSDLEILLSKNGITATLLLDLVAVLGLANEQLSHSRSSQRAKAVLATTL